MQQRSPVRPDAAPLGGGLYFAGVATFVEGREEHQIPAGAERKTWKERGRHAFGRTLARGSTSAPRVAAASRPLCWQATSGVKAKRTTGMGGGASPRELRSVKSRRNFAT